MNGFGLGGLGLRPPVQTPLSSRIEVPTPQLGRPSGWLGGVQQAVQQWGAGLVRQALQRQQRAGADGRSGMAAAGATPGARAGESRATDSAGTSMATLAASTRQVRQQQQAQTLAFVRLLAGAEGAGRPLALPAPPSGPPRTPGGGPAPMATLSRALYMEVLGALAGAPAPQLQAGAPIRPRAYKDADHPARLALPAPDTSTGQALVPAGPRALVPAPHRALPGVRPAVPAAARGQARPAREGAIPLGIGPGLGRPASAAAGASADNLPQAMDVQAADLVGLPVSTPDLVEEPDDESVPHAHGHGSPTAAADPPAPVPVHAHEQPASARPPGLPEPGKPTAPSPQTHAGAAEGAGSPKPLTFEEEREALKAEARHMELQALRDSVKQMRDKLFQAELQRIAKNIDAMCSIM
jgi:hypothetical protein